MTEEHEDLVDDLIRSVDRTQRGNGCTEERTALLAILTAQEARIAALEALCRAFVDYYPCGINPYLDKAYAEGLVALESCWGGKE